MDGTSKSNARWANCLQEAMMETKERLITELEQSAKAVLQWIEHTRSSHDAGHEDAEAELYGAASEVRAKASSLINELDVEAEVELEAPSARLAATGKVTP
jgi:hypothetical protein